MMTTPDIGSDKSSDGAKVIAFVDDLISYYGNRAEKYGRRLWTFKVLGLFFSVSVTVISGISAVKDGWPWVITIVAGLATFPLQID